MTVTLRIKDNSIQDETERLRRAHYTPVATAEYFRLFWTPGVEALGLKYVPQFDDPGISLAQEDLPIVLAELARLKTWMETTFPNGEDGGMIERVETVARKLREVVGCDNMSISFV